MDGGAGVQENTDVMEYLTIPLRPSTSAAVDPESSQGLPVQQQKKRRQNGAEGQELMNVEQGVFSRGVEIKDQPSITSPQGGQHRGDPEDGSKSTKRVKSGMSPGNNTGLLTGGPDLSLKPVGSEAQGSSLRSAFALKAGVPKAGSAHAIPGVQEVWELQGARGGVVSSDDESLEEVKVHQEGVGKEGDSFKATKKGDSEDSDSEGPLPEIDSGMSEEDVDG